MPLPSAARAATLLVTTDAMIPNPIVKTPAMQAILGARINHQLRRTLRSRSRAMSRRSQSLDSPSSRNTMWAVSVAIDDAPRSEIDTLAFLSAIESLIPSPTKQTLRPSFWSCDHVVGLVGGQDLGEVAVHSQRLGQLARGGLVVARDDGDVLDAALAQPLDDLADLGPDRGVQLDRPAQPAVDRHHDHRVAFEVRIVQRLRDFGR